MALIADLVLQTANAPGTGSFSLIAPPTGRRSFVAGCGAGQAYYIGHDGTSWEEGVGTVVAGSPDTLSRDTVYANSLGTTAKINFTTTVQVYNDIPAARALYAIADNGSVPMGNRALTGLGAGFSADHSVRWDQVGDIRVATYSTITSGFVAVPLPSVSVNDLYRIEVAPLLFPSSAQLYMRYSIDGGVTYKQGASDYRYTCISDNGSTLTRTGGSATYVPLTISAYLGAYSSFGEIEFFQSGGQWRSRFLGDNSTDTAAIQDFSAGSYTGTAGVVTHIAIGAVAQTLSSASIRLLRKQF